MLRVRSLMYCLCLSTALLAVGCGANPENEPATTGTDSTQTAKNFDVSVLLTQDEAAGFLQADVNEPKITLPEIAPAQPYLLFIETTDTNKFIQVGVIPDSAALAGIDQTAEKMYISTRDDIIDNEVAVEGVGDEAFWGTLGLHILKGPYYVTIAVGNTDDPANLELAKEISAVVLPRLP